VHIHIVDDATVIIWCRMYVCLCVCAYVCHRFYRVNFQCLRISCYAVPHNYYTLLLENISLRFVFIIYSSLSFFLFSPYHMPFTYLHSRTWLQATPLQYFYQGCKQSNQKLALSRLMHSTHCGNAIFTYQALEWRPAQETLTGCAGLHHHHHQWNYSPARALAFPTGFRDG
jgi:hypothetical protein